MEQRVKELMSDILGLNPDEIEASTSMDSVAAWDSLNHINLILALEEEFGILFASQEVMSLASVSDLYALLEIANKPRLPSSIGPEICMQNS